MTTLESRLKISSKGEIEVNLSTAHAISCSFYTEGCQGGFPELLSKFIHEFYVPEESCQPYTEDDNTCNMTCNNSEIKVSITKYGYVGGFYGAGCEENIIKEIYARGPLIGAF